MDALTSHMTIARLLTRPKPNAPMFNDPIEFAPPAKTECDPIVDLRAAVKWIKSQNGRLSDSQVRAREAHRNALEKCVDALNRKDREAFAVHCHDLKIAAMHL